MGPPEIRITFKAAGLLVETAVGPQGGLRERRRSWIERDGEIRERLRAAQYLLQESQQVPMRASQGDGWLSSLIFLQENDAWWNLKFS